MSCPFQAMLRFYTSALQNNNFHVIIQTRLANSVKRIVLYSLGNAGNIVVLPFFLELSSAFADLRRTYTQTTALHRLSSPEPWKVNSIS